MGKLTEHSNNFEQDINSTGIDNQEQKFKKFVFQIYPENIHYIESLPYQKKHDLINHLIKSYRKKEYSAYEEVQGFSNVKKTIVIILALIIGIPLFLYIANISLILTKNSYMDMQKKFEKLF